MGRAEESSIEQSEATVTAYLGRAWRLLGTAASFSLFGVAGLILGLFVFPLLFLIIRDPGRRQDVARSIVSWAFGAFIRIMSAFGVLSYRIEGKISEVSPPNCLVIANHPTLIDVVFLVWLFPGAECVIKEAVIRNPFMRSVVTASNYISNDDPEQLLTTCVDRLKAGSKLILFPEGTRSVPGQPMKLKAGAAAIAERANSNIQPVLISCSPPTLAKHEPWYRIPRRQPFFHINILSPKPLGELISDQEDQRYRARALNRAFYRMLDVEQH